MRGWSFIRLASLAVEDGTSPRHNRRLDFVNSSLKRAPSRSKMPRLPSSLAFYPPAGHSERRVSFDMSKPAAAAAVAFITLLARLTLLPGVDAQFYQVRGDNPSTCRDRHLGTLLEKIDVITDASAGHQPGPASRARASGTPDRTLGIRRCKFLTPSHPVPISPETSSRRAPSPRRSMWRGLQP